MVSSADDSKERVEVNLVSSRNQTLSFHKDQGGSSIWISIEAIGVLVMIYMMSIICSVGILYGAGH